MPRPAVRPVSRLTRTLLDVVVELHPEFPDMTTVAILTAVDNSRSDAAGALPDMQRYRALLAASARVRLNDTQLGQATVLGLVS